MRSLRNLAVGVLAALFCLFIALSIFPPSTTSAAVSDDLNFQARLMNANGSIVPDGNYNVEFKLYSSDSSTGSSQGSCTGDSNCLWAETRTGANQVKVVDGYLAVNLGSVTPFPANIDWSQQLYLTMNIGGTSSTPTWDGEMNPRLPLTAVPYAFQAKSATQLQAASGSNSGTLQFGSVTNNPAITLPNESGTVCLQSSSSCGFLSQTTADGDYIQLQAASPGSVQTGNFNISGTGIAGALSSGSVAIQPAADSLTTPSLDIKTSLGNNIFTVAADANYNQVGIGLSGNNLPDMLGSGLQVQGAIKLSGGVSGGFFVDNFITPVGTKVTTKINIPIYNPGKYNQVVALGLPSTADTTSRAISLYDARTSAHQPTLAVLSPDENSIYGLSWDGSNSMAYLKNTSTGITLQANGVNIAAFQNSGASSISLNGSTTVTGGVNATTGYSFNGTAGATTTCTSGDVLTNTVIQGGIVTGGSCSSAAGLTGSGTVGTIAMFSTSGTNLGDSALTQSGTTVTAGGDLNVTGNIQTGGTTRIDNTGNLSNIGTITASGNIATTGNVTASGTLTVNGTGASVIMGSLGLGVANPQGALAIANGSWITGQDSAGTGFINMFQVNSQNQIQVGSSLDVGGSIYLPADAGQVTFSDLPIDSSAASGTPESYTMRVGSINALTVYGESDGSGGAQNVRVAIGSSINPQYPLDVTGDINTSTGYRVGGTAGLSSLACSGGQFLQNATVTGGIVTAGNCQSAATGLSGTGSNNYLAKFNSAGNLQQSLIYDDGTHIGIGTASPAYTLDVAGDVNTSGYYRQNGTIVINTTTGGGNTFFGPSGNTSTTGSNNAALGQDALSSNTTGNANMAIGNSSLQYNTTGTANAAFGGNSLVNNVTGGSNTAIGYNSGAGNNCSAGAGCSVTGNSLLGYGTGYLLQTGGNYNTLLGYQAGGNITTGANNIIIGQNVNAASATGSNQLNIGNAITGDLTSGSITVAGSLTVSGTGASSFGGTVSGANAVNNNDFVTKSQVTSMISGSSAGAVALQSTTPGTAQTGNFNISGTGIVGTLQSTKVLSNAVDANSSSALSIGTTNATSITIGQSSTSVALNSATTVTTTSASALVVQDASSNPVLAVNTSGTNNGVSITGNITNVANITSTGVLSNLAVNSYGYTTSNTNGTYAGEYTRLASCTLPAQYDDCRSVALIVTAGDGLSTGYHALVDFRVKQQDSMGSAPIVNVQLSDITGYLTADDFVAVTTTNSASQTTVDLYGKIETAYQDWVMSPQINTGSLQLSWFTSQGFSTTLPAGATTPGTYSEDNAIAGNFFAQNGNSFGANAMLGTIDNYGLGLMTNNTIQMIITNSGDVGIGTASPIYQLDVANGTGIVGRFSGRVIGGDAVNNNEFTTLGQVNSLITAEASDSVALQSTTPGTAQTGNFNISGTGIMGTLGIGTTGNQVIDDTSGTLQISNNLANTGTIQLQAANFSFQTTTGFKTILSMGNDGATLFRNAVNSTTAFQIQDASSANVFTVDTTTDTVTIGQQSSGNYLQINGGGGITAYGTARHIKTIVLAPEYAGAVLDAQSDSACVSSNNGTMTSGYDGGARTNYYQWTSSGTTSQCYDVTVQVPLPSDFGGWAALPDIEMKTDSTANSSYAINILGTDGGADTNYSYSSPGTLGTSWGNVATSSIVAQDTAGGVMTFQVRMSASNGAHIELGNITLKYRSAF